MVHAIVPWIFIECGWSLKDRPKDGVWEGRSGARATGHCRYGVPYRFDRLIRLYLATEAARQGPIVRGKPADITAMFAVSWSEKVTLQRLKRVVNCWYEPAGTVHDTTGFSQRIPIADRFSWCPVSGEFRISLSGDFYRDTQSGAPFSLDIARQLNQAELNLYLWQVIRLHRGERGDIPLTGDGGAYSMLPGAQNPATLRQRVKQYMARIRQVWPECPYWVSPDGTRLVSAPRTEVHGKQTELHTSAHHSGHDPAPVATEQAPDPAARPGTDRISPPEYRPPDEAERGNAAPPLTTAPVSPRVQPRDPDRPVSHREFVQAARDMTALLKVALAPPRQPTKRRTPRTAAQTRRGPP